MTTATEILKLIEAVDPLDKVKLAEIDALIHKWRFPDRPAWTRNPLLKYTRSRDSLKAIRPEGWAFQIYSTGSCRVWFSKEPFNADKNYVADECKTEELAELHAIIQVIDFERGAGKHE